jgi:hypothetical protein
MKKIMKERKPRNHGVLFLSSLYSMKVVELKNRYERKQKHRKGGDNE